MARDVGESVTSMWAFMNDWFTVNFLFILGNLVMGTIVVTSSFRTRKKQRQQQPGGNDPPQLARAPSLYHRIKSFYSPLYRFEDEVLDQNPSQPHHHHLARTKSDTKPASSGGGWVNMKVKKKKKNSAIDISLYSSEEELEETALHRAASETASFGDKEDLDARADNFINRFRQELRLARNDSLLHYKKNVASAVGGGKSEDDVERHRGDIIYETPLNRMGGKDTEDLKGQKVAEFTGVTSSKKISGDKATMKYTTNVEDDNRGRDMARLEDIEGPVRVADWECELLPEHLKRCFPYLKQCLLYCSLFTIGYEFEQDTLVQLWIAEGLIEDDGMRRMEGVGRANFDYLLYKEFIMPSRFDHFSGQSKYKVNDAVTSFLEEALSKGDYLRLEDGKLGDASVMTEHLSLLCEDFDPMTFEDLKKCKHLRTILLLRDYGSRIKQVPRDLFLSLKVLRTLDLSRTHISELPSSIGHIKSLRYLDVSETPIKRLPESLDCLYNLQTLKLRGCLGLVGLPKGMKKLTSLRHLDLDIVRQLISMPTGMGNLTSLQTLQAFLVGDEDGCRIGELKNMNNLSGVFCISRLENVLNGEEAKEAALINKSYLNKLELRWGDLQDEKDAEEEAVLECLQPHSNLEELQILYYSGSMLPSWIGNPSFADLVSLTFYKCRNCQVLPSIGSLPSLKFLSMVGMKGVRDINCQFCGIGRSLGYHAFPKLEKLAFEDMFNLEEWTGVENGDFPCLLQLTIKYCPKLVRIPSLSYINSLKHLEISHCPELPSLPEGGLPTSLELLIIQDCPTIQERCCNEESEDRCKIAHVPSIWIDHQEISVF